MSKSRLLRFSLAVGIISLLGACAVGPPYGHPPYGAPPVVIIDPCHDVIFVCDRGPDHGRPTGPDRGRPDPDRGGHDPERGGHGPNQGPGQARPPMPRPEPGAPHPGHRDEEEQPVKH